MPGMAGYTCHQLFRKERCKHSQVHENFLKITGPKVRLSLRKPAYTAPREGLGALLMTCNSQTRSPKRTRFQNKRYKACASVSLCEQGLEADDLGRA